MDIINNKECKKASKLINLRLVLTILSRKTMPIAIHWQVQAQHNDCDDSICHMSFHLSDV